MKFSTSDVTDLTVEDINQISTSAKSQIDLEISSFDVSSFLNSYSHPRPSYSSSKSQNWERRGDDIFHEWCSRPNCRRSISDIDISQVPDWYRDFYLWCKLLPELLKLSQAILQQLKVAKLGKEGGWNFSPVTFQT